MVWDLLTKPVLNITTADLQRLQELVEQDLDEREYQRFLEQHPVILDPVASPIVPRQQLADVHGTDFVIRGLDDEYTLVEIEKARDRPFTDYPQPSAPLSHALARYSSGSRGSRTIQRRMLKQMNELLYPRIRILTYDDVIASARHVLNNLTQRPVA